MTCSISLTSLYLSPTSPDWRMIVDFDLIPVSPCKQTSFFFFPWCFYDFGENRKWLPLWTTMIRACFYPSSFLGWFITSLVFRVWSIWAGWGCSKTCQREHRNLRLSTIREACTKPGRSASTYERSFSKWGRSRQRSSSFFFFFQVDGCKDKQNNRCLNCHLCSSLEVSEEVRQYLKTPTFDNWYDLKKSYKKKKEAFVCFIYDIMTLLWPANHTWHAYRPATICTRPQNHSLKLDQGYKCLNWEMIQQFHVK